MGVFSKLVEFLVVIVDNNIMTVASHRYICYDARNYRLASATTRLAVVDVLLSMLRLTSSQGAMCAY